jgi:hypothetical protein
VSSRDASDKRDDIEVQSTDEVQAHTGFISGTVERLLHIVEHGGAMRPKTKGRVCARAKREESMCAS